MIRTLVAEQASIIRLGLIALLSVAEDIDVVAEVERGDHVVSASLASRPDVALLATDLPGTDGFSAARALHTALPACHSLIVGRECDPACVLRAAAADAAGFIIHDSAPDLITEAVRLADMGRKVVDPDLAFAALSAENSPLTPRELEALQLAADGATTREIAVNLCLSAGTVGNYLSRATAKAGARNRVEAIRIAEKSGWFYGSGRISG